MFLLILNSKDIQEILVNVRNTEVLVLGIRTFNKEISSEEKEI